MSTSVLAGFSPSLPCDTTVMSCSDKPPCDVAKLTLSDSTNSLTVTADRSWLGAPPPGDAPTHLHADLKSYDVVLETVADLDRPGVATDNIVKLGIATAYAAECGGQHSLVKLRGRGDARNDETWKQSSVPELELLAGRMPGADKPLAAFFSAIWFVKSGTRELVVTAESCGVRGGAAKPTEVLKGLVRIHEKSTFSMTLKAPPWKRLKAERKVTKLLGAGETQSSASRTVEKSGQVQSKSATERTVNTKENTDVTKVTAGAVQGDGHYRELAEEQGRKKGDDYYAETDVHVEVGGNTLLQKKETIKDVDATDEARKLDYEAEYVVRPGVTIKVNGKELNCTQAVNDTLNKLTNFREKVIKPLQDIKEWVPKVGWSADIDVSFLEGSITGEWGQAVAASPRGARFTCVERTYKFTFDIDLAKVTASVQFGLECKSPDILNWFGDTLYEVIALAKLSLAMKASLQKTLAASTLDNAKEPDPVVVKASATPDLSVQGKVHLAGTTLVDVKFGATGEFSAICELALSFSKAPTMTCWAENTDIYAYAQWYDLTSKKPPSPQWKHVMVGKAATGKTQVF